MSRNDPPPAACDIAVVGGGILGLAVARELKLRQPDASICLLEAEGRLAAHQSSHNSGVVHAGVYYQPGSLRAKLCVEGAARLREYCAERGLPWRTTGKLIVATEEGELTRLDELERRARANGVNELTKVDAAEIAQVEPAARGLSALHSPTTAVTDFAAIAESFAQDFETAGGTIHLGTPAAKRLPVDCETAVFCAGLQSDRLARARGGSAEPRIVPIRGGYLKVRADQSDLVRGNVYPVPDPDLPFLGAHLTRTFDGALLIGPTAMITGARDAYRLSTVRRHDLGETLRWPGTWALMRRHWRATLDEAANSVRANRLTRQAARLVPALHGAEVIPGPAGVRAQALDRRGNLVEDFLIERIGDDIHVRNAPSPAATSSLSLAGLIAHEALR
jgi:L-2-hydroxyglutarate oxidase LhgO